MTSRDEFPHAVRLNIAARAGHQCSFPDCRAPTAGPQLDDRRSVNVGVAAHISAASLGGPRFDASMSSESRTSAANGIWLCQTHAKLVDNDPSRFATDLLRQWKEDAERAALEAIGRTAKLNVGDVDLLAHEKEIQRKLDLRHRLEGALLRAPETLRARGRLIHPYDRFIHTKVIIRSLGDRVYPNVDESPGISSWFRLEPFDFYHNGIEFILSLQHAAMDDAGRWRVLRYDEKADPSTHNEIKIWVIGRIPYRNIRALDLDGDEYYREPHLYCAYADNGEPYEEIRYAVCGEGDEYDWPLDNGRRIQDP
jgi:hypothetical protein